MQAKQQDIDDIPIIKSELLSKNKATSHGFFTRKGGVSTGLYDSLNCGAGSNDSFENVKENHLRVINKIHQGDELNILDHTDNLHTLYQIHSNKVITITDNFEGKQEADGLVTKQKGMILGILTADCTPVLFSDSKNQVIGAAHAGWKGAFAGILENTISQMENLGAQRRFIDAAIGPTISQNSYEVGSEFYDRFINQSQSNTKFFIPSDKQGHYMFNLPLYVKHRLKNASINNIDDVKYDTCADEENFFSYRRSCLRKEADYGRNMSAICLL